MHPWVRLSVLSRHFGLAWSSGPEGGRKIQFRTAIRCNSMWISPVLPVVTNIDTFVLGGIGTHLSSQNKGDLLWLSGESSVLILVSDSVCNTASRSESSVYSEIITTVRDQAGTMQRSIKKFPWTICRYTMFQRVTAGQSCSQRRNGHVRVGQRAEQTA